MTTLKSRVIVMSITFLLLSVRSLIAQELSYVATPKPVSFSKINALHGDPEKDTIRKVETVRGNYPDCTPPSNLRWSRASNQTVQINWDGIDAQPNLLQYQLRYKLNPNDAWREQSITEGHQFLLDMPSNIADNALLFEVQKSCFDNVSSRWISSVWVSSESGERAASVVPCSFASDGITFTLQDVWGTAARVKIVGINFSNYTNTKYQWYNNSVPFGPEKTLPQQPVWTYNVGYYIDIDLPSDPIPLDPALKLKITGTSPAATGICSSFSNNERFTCALYGEPKSDGTISLIGGVSTRYRNFELTTISQNSVKVAIGPAIRDGDNANQSKGMFYNVTYTKYNPSTKTTIGLGQTVPINTGKEVTLSNLDINTSYKIDVELMYNGVPCKKITKYITTPSCFTNISVTAGTNTAVLTLNGGNQLGGSNVASIVVFQNGVVIGSYTMGSGGSFTIPNLNPAQSYTINYTQTSNGFFCTTQVLTVTTIATCEMFTGLTAEIKTKSASETTITMSKAAAAPIYYLVKWKATGTSIFNTKTITNGNTTVVTGLTPNQSYDYEIIPVIGIGEGLFCTPITKSYAITCEEIMPEFKDFTIKVSNINQAQVNITGLSAGNGLTYKVEYKKTAETQWTNSIITTGLSSNIITLDIGPGYEFKVTLLLGSTACNTLGPKVLGLFDCNLFTAVKDSSVTNYSAFLYFTGVNADSIKNNTFYEIEYYEKNAPNPLFVNCIKGKSYQLQNLKPDTEYEGKVIWTLLKSVTQCNAIPFSFKTLPVVIPQSLQCGGNAAPVTNVPQTPELGKLIVGNNFTMYGFPIEVETVNDNAPFSGTGFLTVPFVDSLIHVDFSGLKLNDVFQAFEGQVVSAKDPSGKVIAFGGGTINFGGEICVKKKVDEVDENGFDEDGNYTASPPYIGYQPGMPIDSTKKYDPCGFDKDGNHKDTGDSSNSDGCTRDDIKNKKAACTDCYKAPDAYSWLGSSGPGAALYLLKKDSLPSWTHKEINKLIKANKDSIALARTLCQAKRLPMLALTTQLNYDTLFLFGEQGRYFREGMSKHFLSKPLPMQFESYSRNKKTIELENQHVALYGCDQKIENFKSVDSLLQKMSIDPDFTAVLANIATTIKSFNKADSAKYHSDTALKGRINLIVSGIVTTKLSKTKTTFVPYSTPLLKDDVRNTPSLWTYSKSTTWSNSATSLFHFNNPFSRLSDLFRRNENQKLDKPEDIVVINKEAIYMPIAKKKAIGGKTYSIFFDNINISPTAATVDVVVEIPIPNKSIPISFSAKGIGFGLNGFATAGGQNPRLSLNTNIELALANSMLLTLEGAGPKNTGTYVEFDCNGFAGIGIEASFEVCRKYLIPLDSVTLQPLPEPKRVRSHISSIFVKSWDDFMIDNLSIQPFVVVGAEQFKWKVQGITLDMSATKKSSNIKYPAAFAAATASMPYNITTNGWKGFYMANLSVIMPEGMGADDNLAGGNTPPPNAALEIGVKDCIFDNTGFTGELFAKNALTLDKGTLGGWAFSLDTINISIQSNTLQGARFSGLVNVPLFKKDKGDKILPEDCMKYTAQALPGDKYSFRVHPPKDALSASVWKANVKLDSTSSIEIKYENKKFTTEAILNGRIAIDGEISSDSKITTPEVKFENMILTNQKPYVTSIGTWGLPTQVSAKFGGFELEFNGFTPVNIPADKLVGIGLGAKVKLAPGDGIDISANATFAVLGKIIEGKHQRWVFEKIKVKEMRVNATFKENHIEGNLVFYDKDPGALQWGKGFRGYLDCKFAALKVDVKVIAQFGRTDFKKVTAAPDYRYFMLDAMINLGKGIDVAPGFQLKGFGGGITYHLERLGFAGALDSNVTKVDTTKFLALGESLSKVAYAPNEAFGLGLKATVAIAATDARAFNANVSLEVLMNSPSVGGGIAKIVLGGNARFMSDFKIKALPTLAPAADPVTNPTKSTSAFNAAPISARAEIIYNFNAKTFDATLEIAINSPDNSMTGAGQAALHLDPNNEWWINIGTPDQRIFAKMKLGKTNYMELNAYLDIGTKIPKFPELPSDIQSMTGLGNLSANQSTRASGKGFAFGAAAKLKFNIDAWKMYASVDIALGFDVMVQNYGKNTVCSNLNNQVLGINGWYASGQLYAYISGTAGVRYKGKDIPIGSLAVAAALQAKLPNPFYARGAVAVKYSILGGLVKGSTKLAFEIGEECQVASVNVALTSNKIEIINDISPDLDQKNVPIFQPVTVSFNVPLDVSFEDGGHSFIAFLKTTTLKSLKTDFEISLNKPVYDQTRESVELKSLYPYQGNDSLLLTVEVAILKDGATYKTDKREVIFTTSEPLDYIPQENVRTSYPLAGQYNYYKEQVKNLNKIELNYPQYDLFSGKIKNTNVIYKVRFREKGASLYNYISMDYKENYVLYKLPSDKLKAEKIYELQVVAIDANTPPITFAVDEKFAFEKILYKMYFRNSKYATFGSKIDALNQTNLVYSKIKQVSTGKKIGDDAFKLSIPTSFEPFDKYELLGEKNMSPMIEVTASYNENLIVKELGLGNKPAPNTDTKPTANKIVTGSNAFLVANKKYDSYADLLQSNIATKIEITEANFTDNAVLPNISPQYFEYYLNNTLVDDILNKIEEMDTKYTEFLETVCPDKDDYNECIASFTIETATNSTNEDLFKPAELDFYKKYKNEQNIEGSLGDYPVFIKYRMNQIASGFGDSEQKVVLKKQ